MRPLLLSLTAASALMAAASMAPAHAMAVGTAPSMQAAVDNAGVLQDVRYVCRHRYYSSRRVCWWQPGPYGRRWHHRRWHRHW
jgi:hypothetical protein